MDLKSIKRDFYANKNKIQAIDNLKRIIYTQKDFLKIQELFNKELKPFKHLFDKSIYNKVQFPRSYSEISCSGLRTYKNYKTEYVWCYNQILSHAEILNIFIVLKNDFEHSINLGDLVKASNLLDQIENDICYSIWGLKSRILLNELSSGRDSNQLFKEKILKNEGDLVVKLVSELYVSCVDNKYSVSSYNKYFKKTLQGLKDANFINDIIYQFLHFKCNFIFYKRYNLAAILALDSHSSIIDQYESFIRVSELCVSDNDDRDWIINILNTSNSLFFDQRIKNIISLKYTLENNGISELKIFDEYERGNYSQVISLCEDYLRTVNSNNVEVCDVYLKSLVALKKEFKGIFIGKSILEITLKALYKIISKSYSDDNEFLVLLKQAVVFDNCFGLNLFSLIQRELKWETNIDYALIGTLSNLNFSPYLTSSFYNNKVVFISILDNIAKINTDSLGYRILVNRANKLEFVSVEKSLLELSEFSLNYFNGVNKFLIGNFNDAISDLEFLLQYNEINVFDKFGIINILFKSYVNTNRFVNSIKLYVDTYLYNFSMVRKLDEGVLLDYIINNFRYLKAERDMIELSIFLNITNQEKVKIKQTVELFLRAKNLSRPSQLSTLHDGFSLSKVIYFFKNVVTTDVLQLFRVFKSLNEVNLERIRICQILVELDEDNSFIYNSEIANLTQKNFIIKVIKDFDEGKIFVNEEKIRFNIQNAGKRELSSKNPFSNDSVLNIVDSYQRIADIAAYYHEKKYFSIIDTMISGYQVEDVIKRSLASIFLEIRDEFVYSNEYGLNSYLSTRIRHGTLSNHIRSVFENNNLVTSEDKDGYIQNEYWIKEFSLLDDQSALLQKNLALFSKAVDQITGNLKDSLIQCKTEKNIEKPFALFDYSYTQEELYEYFDTFRGGDLNSFLDLVFELLWERTSKNLESIKSYLENVIKTELLAELSRLEQSIENLGKNLPMYPITYSVKYAMTEIQKQLNSISHWFNRTVNSQDGEYSLLSLAETSFQITKNINPKKNIDIILSVDNNIFVKGSTFQFIIDILRIGFDNMIKHFSGDPTSIEGKFMSVTEDNSLKFIFTNNMSECTFHDDIKDKLTKVKNNWQLIDDNVSKEDGSGFSKIKNIIYSIFESKSSSFDYNLDNEVINIEITFDKTNVLI
ncbi:hypothetical protein [Sphingobacterium faecium]|uniref:hypothetical protein n=1 Tax=Sphingobacterium faecium TaxID=34087 RepID=UPI0024797C00|nr:hypothetical protein [Sphingobacterium faecium]WGQ14519.1 hypothetical protein QG727_21155 [Sphingobacterium faecium]